MKNPKWRNLFYFLMGQGERTSVEIRDAVNTVAVGSMVADLRKLGCNIKSRYIKQSDAGAKVFGYTMTSFPKNIIKED